MNDRLIAMAALAALGLSSACAAPCLDDGLGQAACPMAASQTESDSDTATGTETMTASVSDSNSMSATASDSNSSATTGTDTDTDTNTDSDGTQYCLDADGDGFGDPDDCTSMPADDRVPNADDCDDASEQTFPGAAQNEDDEACRKDEDDDGYGDDDPPPGVDPGGDCDDGDAQAFPGAATNEDPAACTRDSDGDGWGDADPGGDIDPGADCYADNPDLNPDTLALSGIVGEQIVSVGLDAMLTARMDLDPPGGQWDPVSAALQDDGTLWSTDNAGDELSVIDYQAVCDGNEVLAPVTDAPNDHNLDVICGITFGPDGNMYGLHTGADTLVQFDLTTGLAAGALAVTFDGNPIDVGSCGLSYDCHEGRLLWANGVDGNVYALDHETGIATLVADTDGVWNPTGIAYDPVGRQAYVTGATELLRVQIDASNTFESLGTISFGAGAVSVSNLEYLPACTAP